MNKRKILIAKASLSDIEELEKFLDLSEFVFSNQSISEFDVCDPNRLLFEKIKKEQCFGLMGIGSEDDFIKMQMLKRLFINCSGRWPKITNTTTIMVKQICDPSISFIDLHPFIKRSLDCAIMGE